MAVRNLYSLGLLRNGKVYANKQAAMQALTQSSTNDGVAKLARYLEEVLGGDPIIRTLVGFYANAAEMEYAGGGQSSYTILDIDGSAADLDLIKQQIAAINSKIGAGIDGTTLTDAINDINDRLGSGFTSAHTVADALEELDSSLKNKLKVSLEEAQTPTSGYLKTYILSQGLGDDKEEIGKIDIPKDMVVSGGSLVHGTWVDENTFIEDQEGPDTAIKIEFANADIIYINTKDLVDFYVGGNGITVDNTHNTISIKYNPHSESFLVVDEDGIKVQGIQAAIDAKADAERLEGSDGISIASNQVKAVAAKFSSANVANPISVDKDGIKFAKVLDCGFFDTLTAEPKSAADVEAIQSPIDTEVFLDNEEAIEALAKGNGKVFKSIAIEDASIDKTIELTSTNAIEIDGLEIGGTKDNGNGKVNFSAPAVIVQDVVINNGATVYNVFEGDQTNANLEVFEASNVVVDDPSLAHNVFNIYKPKNDAVITVKDSKFNLTVDNSNIMRIANYANSTGVTVNFENVEWTYENSLATNYWYWAGLLLYQPASSDVALGGDLSKIQTWKFNFKNCKYNGVKVTENNFGEHNQVFITYNIGGNKEVENAASKFTVNFE